MTTLTGEGVPPAIPPQVKRIVYKRVNIVVDWVEMEILLFMAAKFVSAESVTARVAVRTTVIMQGCILERKVLIFVHPTRPRSIVVTSRTTMNEGSIMFSAVKNVFSSFFREELTKAVTPMVSGLGADLDIVTKSKNLSLASQLRESIALCISETTLQLLLKESVLTTRKPRNSRIQTTPLYLSLL